MTVLFAGFVQSTDIAAVERSRGNAASQQRMRFLGTAATYEVGQSGRGHLKTEEFQRCLAADLAVFGSALSVFSSRSHDTIGE
jgi:hypothetical protein